MDKAKDGAILDTTYKNILKLDQRDTNETIVQNIKFPPDVVPKAAQHKKRQSTENLMKIPKFSYIELSEFWKNHKNSLEKEETDMPPICYENKTLFDMISYTAN